MSLTKVVSNAFLLRASGATIFFWWMRHTIWSSVPETCYSETLVKEDFLALKKKLKIYGKKLENTLERCNKEMLVLKRQCEKLLVLEEMDSFLFALFLAAAAMDELLQKKEIS